MKKLLILISLFIPFIAITQTVTYTYNFDNPKIEALNDYFILSFDNTMPSAILGEPIMPYFAANLLIKPGCEAVDYKIEYLDKKEIKIKGKLLPKQAVRPVSQLNKKYNFYRNNEIYSSKLPYPAKKEGRLTTHFYKGHAIANIAFTPVEYIPAEDLINYYSSVKITIVYKPTEKAQKSINLIKYSEEIQSKVHNPEQISQYKSYYTDRTASDYDILVISSSQYKDKFEEINDLYLKYGLITQFKDIAEIYNEELGVDQQEKIRNYIIAQYQQHSIEYVVLGGDVEIVPYRGFYCTVQSSSVYESSDIPSDLYYSALDGTWNDDNDDKWGEIGEDDLYPDVSVARMPFSNMTEFNAQKNKILKYQAEPVLGELNSPLLAGEELYWNPLTYGADFLRLLVGHRDDNGYTTIGIPPTDPYDSIYAKDYVWGKSDIIQRLNQGASFVHHSGHSNWDYTMMLYNSDITNQNFNKLDGVQHNYTLIYTHGCICGAFDENDCIAEYMLNIDNFAVAGCFNSRYGWFNEGQTEGPSAHLHREFIDALYTEKIGELAKAHKESKTATVPWVNAPGQWEEGALRWCFYCSNAIGYAALKIWRDNPYTLNVEYNNNLNPNVNTYLVNVLDHNNETIEGATCVLLDENNNFLGRGFSNENGECSIDIIAEIPETGNVKLLVSAYNTMPYEYLIGINNENMVNIEFDNAGYVDENQNGILEYGETLEYTVIVTNIGNKDANNITILANTTSDDLIIENPEQTISILTSNESVELSFNMMVSMSVIDQTTLPLSIVVTEGEDSWIHNDNLIANAPDLHLIGHYFIDDNDSNINADEVLEIEVELVNKGKIESGKIDVEITFESDMITFPDGNTTYLDNLNVDEQGSVKIKIKADKSLIAGTELNYTIKYINRELVYLEDFTTIVKEPESVKDIENTFKIYPNPVSDLLNIKAETHSGYIEIVNNNGQIVYNSSFSGNTQLNLLTLKAGVYIVNIYTEKKSASYKVIKK